MRESLCTVCYSGCLHSEYHEEMFENLPIYAFYIQLKITSFGNKVYKPIYKVVAFKGGQFEKAIRDKIITENIGKRLEIAGMEIFSDSFECPIVILQRLIYDDYLISSKDAEQIRKNTPDLSEDDDLFEKD